LLGKKDRKRCISWTYRTINIWRQTVVEKQNIVFHFWEPSNKSWTFKTSTNQPWTKGRQGTKYKGSIFYLVLCWWGNSCCSRPKWRHCILVSVSSGWYLILLHFCGGTAFCVGVFLWVSDLLERNIHIYGLKQLKFIQVSYFLYLCTFLFYNTYNPETEMYIDTSNWSFLFMIFSWCYAPAVEIRARPFVRK
jgi:hypothetical protein